MIKLYNYIEENNIVNWSVYTYNINNILEQITIYKHDGEFDKYIVEE